MEIAAWAERAMAPIKSAGLAPADYNVICNVVLQIGQQRGEQLVNAIDNAMQHAVRTRGPVA